MRKRRLVTAQKQAEITKKSLKPNIAFEGAEWRVWMIFLPLRSLDFELFGVILYMHINLLFARALLFLEERAQVSEESMKLFNFKKVLLYLSLRW